MAKYILNRTSRGANVVNCSILDENCLANTYRVQFADGRVRNVSKKKIHDLDALDEAVLDRLKRFATRLWDNVVRAGKYIFATVKGIVVGAFSPVNTMIAAKEVNGLTFIPSDTVAEIAEENGIEAEEVIDEQEEDPRAAKIKKKDDELFWRGVISNFLDEMKANGGEVPEDTMEEVPEEAYESRNYRYRRKERLYEAREQGLELASKSIQNVSSKELVKMLLIQYNQYVSGAAGDQSERPIPYCVWGAPGIGKSQITRGLVDTLRDAGFNANLIGINASAMRKDDWALPGHKKLPRKVKNANGEEFMMDVDTAVEMPKNWLPMWNPEDVDEENGITAAMLDDVANGGHGDGDGDGGIFFIDEISRIAPDVNNTIMQLLQTREFQGRILGSKWMFVAAGNRTTDLGENSAFFKWDKAQTDRFQHVNLVPQFDEWLEWAESPIHGTDIPHIHPLVVAFLRAYPQCWYNPKMNNKGDDKDKVGRTISPNLRTWEQISKEIRAWSAKAADPRMAKVLAALGQDPNGKEDIGAKATTDIFSRIGGEEVGQLAKGYMSFDARFTASDAKNVWTMGDKTPINWQVNNATIDAAIDKILGNYPNRKKVAPRPGAVPRLPVTAAELENVIKYLLAAVDTMDERIQGAKDPVLRAMHTRLLTKLSSDPYFLALSNPNSEDVKTFAKPLKLLLTRLRATEKTMMGQ